jgi:hypothetical protein
MISEQDFILTLRRLNRHASAHTVVNVVRELPDYNAATADLGGDNVETSIKQLAKKSGGDVFVMSNGDLFLIFSAMNPQQLEACKTSLASTSGDAAQRVITAYNLPQDYMALRERANVYVELANASEHMGAVQSATLALQAHDVGGPLSAWSLSQVETLIESLDIKRYVRTQPVYHQGERGVWEKKFIDFYVSIVDLKRERFPRLVLDTPQRLFLELCYSLDRKLLMELTNHTEQWENKHISINLSVETVLSSVFAQFCHVIPKTARSKINFEIHRSEVFLNFTTTRNAIGVLKEEGFNVGIDGITASVLPFIRFENINVDYYKVTATREKWSGMNSPDVIQALQAIPSDKIIFSQCDHDEALALGQKLGVKNYQGWLIDDVANAIIN